MLRAYGVRYRVGDRVQSRGLGVVTLIAALAAAGAAHSADLIRPIVKAPAAPAALLWDWTGSYIGIQAGGGWGEARQTDSSPFSSGWYGISGGLVGITGGYNWQVGQAVIGFESDSAWSNIGGSTNGFSGFNGPCGGATPHCEAEVQYFGTARLRLGYAMGRWLPFVTGGMATGYLHGAEGDTVANFAAGSGAAFHFGWTVGGGIEAMIDPHWSAKIEYLYADLRDGNTFIDQFLGGGAADEWVATHFNILRVGLNYKFAPGPALLPFLPPNPGPGGGPWIWHGLYAGVNFGSGAGTAKQSDTVFDRGSYDVGGVVVGGTLGYNWQGGYWVYGLEGDFDYARIKGATSGVQDFTTPPCNFATFANCEAKLSWLGTGRARIGYAWDRLLPYVTGGVAVGSLQSSEGNGSPPSGSGTVTRVGWTVGGGIEAKINDRWSAKFEYLYVDLGSGEGFVDTYPGGGQGSENVSFRANIVRGGFNYRFH
jgi:outer membrane immunogenic protein